MIENEERPSKEDRNVTVDLEQEENTNDEEEDKEKFDWTQYLKETKSKAAPVDCFYQAPKPPENLFQVGQKLEAYDPRNPAVRSVATVVATYGPKIKLRLDGSGKSNDFWTLVDSKIHPFGYVDPNGVVLQPPLSYEKDPVRYQTQIINAAKKSKNLAPENCFPKEPTRPVSNLFKVGMKLEATDARNPTIICPATVTGFERDKIRIEWDGWSQTDLFRHDSRDLYPCGWWQQAGIDLAMPPNSKKERIKKRDVTRPPSTTTASRPSSTTSANVQATAAAASSVQPKPASDPVDFRNIFETVLAKYAPPSPVNTSLGSNVESTSAQKSAKSLMNTSFGSTPGQDSSGMITTPVIDLQKLLQASSSSTTPSSTTTPSSAAAATPSLSVGSTPILPKHAARKSIAPPQHLSSTPSIFSNIISKVINKDTPKISPTTTVKKGINGTSEESGASKKRPASTSVSIPQPDTVITLNNKATDAHKLTLYLNENCNGGPYLDMGKMSSSFAKLPNGLPLHQMIPNAFQFLVSCAYPNDAQKVFDAIPTAEMKSKTPLLVTLVGQNFGTMFRKIPVYGSMLAAKRALYDVLLGLEACPNLLAATDAGCDSCVDCHVAKKIKPNDRLSIDMTRKDGPSTGIAEKAVEISDGQGADNWWSGQDPSHWKVDDVVRFIRTVIDVQAAELFKRQEIDGRALVLLTPDILIKYMNVRVGPAVKISNAIERLKGTNRPAFTNTMASGSGSNTGNIENE